jgi:hypothetical protein
MNWVYSVEGFIRANETTIIFILSALSFVFLLCILFLLAKVGKLAKRVGKAAKAASAPIGDMDELARRLEGIDGRIAELGGGLGAFDKSLGRSIQRVGLVKFDAFPDVGGEQSFALALLDRDLNGVVISNLYSRSDSRVYAKEITEGRSQQTLSDEEKEALRRAGELSR